MNAIAALWKRDFATVRQLERKCYRLLKPLVVLMGVGLLLCLTSLFTAFGLMLCVLSGILLFIIFLWVIRLQKRPRREIRCPYCTNRNTVFQGIAEFECDICERSIRFDQYGAPVPADGSLDDARPVSVYDVGTP